jgi:hypothetical protein
MMDVINKAEYFAAMDDEALFERLKVVSRDHWAMKHVQDAWVLSQTLNLKNKRILEVGGGHSRFFRCLDPSNDMINLDKLLGLDGGPKDPPAIPGVTNIRGNLGEFRPELEENTFDYLVSISVMEHIPGAAYPDYWLDHARLLKPGGIGIHAIDCYITDVMDPQVEKRLDTYLSNIEAAGLRLVGPNTLPRPLVFLSSYASNADYGMWRWNQQAPKLTAKRSTHQCVSLKLVVTKD